MWRRHFLLQLTVWCQHSLLRARLFSYQKPSPRGESSDGANLISRRCCSFQHVLSQTFSELVIGCLAPNLCSSFAPYLLSDSRVRRIIVPTTCCTRLVLRAGDLLLHRSFSSIYLKRAKKKRALEDMIPTN